jgi:hypothetical protein
MATKKTDAAPATIPNPPGGGSWTWNDEAGEWLSNDTVAQPAEPGAPAQQNKE